MELFYLCGGEGVRVLFGMDFGVVENFVADAVSLVEGEVWEVVDG